MFEFHENDPLFNLNNEKVSEQDIQLMEGAAYAVLEKVPVTVVHEYAKQLPSTAVMIFRVEEVQYPKLAKQIQGLSPAENIQDMYPKEEEIDDPDGDKSISITVAHRDESNVLASWSYDVEKQSEDLDVVEIDGPDWTLAILQEALADEYFSDEEKRALKYITDSVLELKPPYTSVSKEVSMDDIDLVDQILAETEEAAKERFDSTIHLREFSKRLNDHYALTVTNIDINGDADDLFDNETPKLRVVLENSETGIHYVFTRSKLGDVKQFDCNASGDFVDEYFDEVEERIIEEMTEEMGFHQPTKEVVNEMLECLLHAFFIEDLSPSTGQSD